MITRRQRDMLADPLPYLDQGYDDIPESEYDEFVNACKAALNYITELEATIDRLRKEWPKS